MNKLSSYLYAHPSFVEGFARLVDIGNTLSVYNTSLTADQADTLAILSDWVVVGDDLRSSLIDDIRSQQIEEQVAKALLREAQHLLACSK